MLIKCSLILYQLTVSTCKKYGLHKPTRENTSYNDSKFCCVQDVNTNMFLKYIELHQEDEAENKLKKVTRILSPLHFI